MTRTIIDIHVIQTVPPNNINRDDTGSPKTALYGGVRRARVSSQAWKRATRVDFATHLDKSELGVRTKRVVELVAEEVARQSPDMKDRSQAIATEVLTKGGITVVKPRKGEIKESEFLLFLSRRQVSALASLGIEAARAGDLNGINAKRAQATIKDANSIDLSLFGRMVANVTDLTVDAAAQVAHAISVHAVETEYDYFTAVDDHKQADVEEDAGAGMIGTVEFSSSTLYRYATVDVNQLHHNLGDTEATRRAISAFIRSFVTSMPTGKQTTFANRTVPDAVVLVIREDQPVSLAGAFEEPVKESGSGGRISVAAARMAQYANDIDGAFGRRRLHTWVVGVGDRVDALNVLGDRVDFETALGRVAMVVDGRFSEPR